MTMAQHQQQHPQQTNYPWVASDVPLIPHSSLPEPISRPVSRGLMKDTLHQRYSQQPSKPSTMQEQQPYIFDEDNGPPPDQHDSNYPLASVEGIHAPIPLAPAQHESLKQSQPFIGISSSVYQDVPSAPTPELIQHNSYASSMGGDSYDGASTSFGSSPYVRPAVLSSHRHTSHRTLSDSVLSHNAHHESSGVDDPCVSSLSQIQPYSDGDTASQYDEVAPSFNHTPFGSAFGGSPYGSRMGTPEPYSRSGSPFQRPNRYPSPGPYGHMQRSYSDHQAQHGSGYPIAADGMADGRYRMQHSVSPSPFQSRIDQRQRPGVFRSDSMSSLGKASPLRNSRTSQPTASFPCPLAAYGCGSSFGSKNEWKRHVNTQHLRLDMWRCDECPDRGITRPNDFNRKDLFIQHLRRMHQKTSDALAPAKSVTSAASLPANAKRSRSTTLEETDPLLVEAERRCHIIIRTPPEASRCLFCPAQFSGHGSWEERMEHIGRHLEQNKKEGRAIPIVADWNHDEATEDWLEAEGLIIPMGYGWQIADGRSVARHRAA